MDVASRKIISITAPASHNGTLMIAAADQLGVGIYTPAEAAFYARVKTQTMNRWLFGAGTGEAVVTAQFPSDDEKTVTFLDFVQALAIRAIRIQYKIPLQKIRKAVQKAEEEFGVEYPLARRHTTYLLSDGAHAGHGELIIRLGRESDCQKWVQLSGKASGNFIIHEVAELYMESLDFGGEGLAAQFTAWSKGGHEITMNPHRLFGEPVVTSCGYTAQALWEANIAEGGIKAAAKAYGVSTDEVEAACEYYDHLKNAA